MEGGFTDGNVVNADGGRILIQEEIHIPVNSWNTTVRKLSKQVKYDKPG